jgi:hypothetical protein
MVNRFIKQKIFLVIGLVFASSTMAQSTFQGDWSYQQSCGWRHTANLGLKQKDNKVTGQWDDGTKIRGENGDLQGKIVSGKLYVRYCNEDDQSNEVSVCPKFNSNDRPDYYILNGEQLIWYKVFGSGYRKYLTLHRVIKGKAFPTDNHCPEDDQ